MCNFIYQLHPNKAKKFNKRKYSLKWGSLLYTIHLFIIIFIQIFIEHLFSSKHYSVFFLKAFLLVYISYTGGTHCEYVSILNMLALYAGLVHPHHHAPSSLPLAYLKQLQITLLYFIYVYKVHQPYSPSFIPFRHPPSPTDTHLFIWSILQSCLILIPKSVFKGVSWWISAANTLYFVSSTSLLLSQPLSFPSPIIQQLSVHIVMSSACIDTMYFDIVDFISFSFPFLPPTSSTE
jgi:hypothetical protein